MSSLNKNLYAPDFAHIYVEKSVRDDALTRHILSRFPKAVVIDIDHYKDIFARSKQHFGYQKKSQKLILARNTGTIVYAGAAVSQDFGHEHFYYTSSVLNCVYNCEYCFLQGMFPSANIVMFVNIEDYFNQIDRLLDKHPVYLCISYESDLLALEKTAPFASEWLAFASSRPDLTIELRTKSANYASIRKLRPADNLILAWTLSPDEVVHRFEHGTPSLATRMRAVAQAIADGWQVRISFDPVLNIPNWQKHYGDMIDQVFNELPAEQINDFSTGTFRMAKDYLKKMRKENHTSAVIHYSYELTDGVYSYDSQTNAELLHFVHQKMLQHIPSEKIYSLA